MRFPTRSNGEETRAGMSGQSPYARIAGERKESERRKDYVRAKALTPERHGERGSFRHVTR
jgi:hypothetical protein